MRGEKGFALVIALVVTTLLVALLVEFVNEVYVDTSHSHNFVAAQQASLLAESGIDGGIQLLKASSKMRLNEKFSSPLELWGQPRSFEVDNGMVNIVIEEESGKIDLNSATSLTGTPTAFSQAAPLLRLFDNLKLSRDLYEALADWVDTDETPRPNGAEQNYYQTLKPPHLVHNKWLDSVEELALIRGFTPEVVAKLKPFVTVYGSANSIAAAKININTAPKEVLASLHDDMVKGGKVEEVLEYRKTKVIKNLPDVFGSSPLTNELALNVNCAGSIYRIHAEGKVGETVSVVEAVVTDVDTLKPRVLYWRQY